MKKSGAAVPLAKQKSFAEEVDRRVAQRTAELTAANEQLKKELAERKRAEAALREDNLFNLIVNSIPVPVAVTSPSGEVEALNQPTLEYYGRTFEELKGWKSSDVVHPDDLQRTIAAQLSARQTGNAYNVESRHRRADGVYRWFNVLGLPLRDAQENILHWFHLLVDIDDRKRTEEASRSAERNLSLTIDTIPTFIQVSRSDGTVLSVNKTVLDYYGVTLQDMQKEDFRSRVYHPDDAERLSEERKEALKRPVQFEYEQRALGKDGKYRWFLVRYNPLLNDQGEIDRWYATAFDIEDRKRAEAQLTGEKRLLEMVASGHSLTSVLSELCRFVETTTADCKCGIYFIDWNSGTFQFGLAPSLPATFSDRVKGLTVTADAGPCGIAAQSKTQVIVTDVASDPRFQSAAIRPLLLAHELRSHWSTPICSRNGQVLATFAIFQTSLSDPTQLQLDLISQVTHIASIAIERALNEEALKSSEMQFKTIFDEAGAGIALVDLKGEAPIRNNRALQKMLGCSEEELGRFETFDRLTHENDREKDAATFRELKDGKRDSLRLEKHFVLEDGRSIWANVIFNLLRDDEGHPHYIIAIHEDITERKRALETLQAQQDLLDLAQKAARAMAFDWYIQEEINTWSPEQEALHGLTAGSFDGKYESWKELVYPADWPLVRESLKQAQETGEISAEYRVVWPDGSIHWLMAQGQMFFDDLERPLRMVGFTADITSRKLIEEELRRSEAFLAQAQQVSRTGSFSWHVATDEITWSEQLYRIYGFEPGTTITLDVIRTRVHPEDLTLYEKMVAQARNGSEDFECQYRLLMPDQSIKYMHAVARATRDQSGQLEYIAAVRDVTARRLADEALDKARSELAHVARVMSLGALTASIAHEVNQPLSGIITNASTCVKMLDAEPPNVDGARETAKRTIRDGRRAADVITRLRALFTKKEATTELVDLNEATREVIALSKSELERNRIITRTELADQLHMVTGDRVQLQQVIINLLRNGSDAMSNVDDRPRELLFKTEVDENDCVRLSVRDVGTGLDPQTLDQLFRSFYTTKADGMGIGLSVSRSIIENHRGRIWVTANDDAGVTFSFSIPCAA
ncbi:MAG TPA: PAS domain-containing protein [Pyrinomonadaceae bacterium]|nr:PAS domain-containing protein [Pyrinomonadaceae bacterium]